MPPTGQIRSRFDLASGFPVLVVGFALLLPLSYCGAGFAQHSSPARADRLPRMVDPAIDEPALSQPGAPFSYPSRPTDQLSVMDAPSGAEITAEGDLYTGFGELDFYVGIDRKPVHQRIRTLRDGYLPVYSYTVEQEGLRYRFTFFAASVGPSPELSAGTGAGIVVNFVRVTIQNPGQASRAGYLTTSWRYQGEQTTTFATGDDEFVRPIADAGVGGFHQPGEPFHPRSVYTVRQNAFLRDGKAVYLFPLKPEPYLATSFREYYNRNQEIGAPATVLPTTPMATAEYQVVIPPGAERTLDFKVPLLPVDPDDGAFAVIDHAGFEERELDLERIWRGIFADGIDIQTPESKVNDTYRSSLVHDLVALNKVDGNYVQTINQFQYHRFYLRDSADFVHMYDTSGYPSIARHVLDFFSTRQQPDGNFLSQPGQYDGWGEALWTYGEHFRITHDRAFAAEVYPRITRAVAWLEKALAGDPLGLVPATDVRDNEYVAGHLTGYNFLALDGLQAAELLAHAVERFGDESHDKAIEEALRSRLMARLATITAKTGGYIPPSLDGDGGGTDWGNLLSVTPEPQLDPWDPRVTATLRYTQERYQEGLITYRQPDQGTYLHHYLTIKNTLTELVRGEQEQAIREFYAELMHTTSTHAGWEYSIRPWGGRDFSGNLSPHGWFAADFRNLLRNMMLREQGDQLHLLSAVSPAWIGGGKSIHVHRAVTYFGHYAFDLTMPSDRTAVLSLDPAFETGTAPRSVMVHLPWFMQVTNVSVDGKSVPVPVSRILTIRPDAHIVQLQWRKLTIASDIPVSYADSVARYLREYRSRFERLDQGTPAATSSVVATPYTGNQLP